MRVLAEKLTVVDLVRKVPVCHETERSLTHVVKIPEVGVILSQLNQYKPSCNSLLTSGIV
jgi:hypothetical protein